MPNHIQNVLEVTGPNAFERLSAYFTYYLLDDVSAFDFNKIIPMPEVAKDVEESSLSPMVIALLTEGPGMVEAWNHFARWDKTGSIFGPWPGLLSIKRDQIREKLEQAHPGCLVGALKMARCLGETGYKSWYDWSIANWGTKWNAYQSSITGSGDSAVIRFQTAWEWPEPVMNRLFEIEKELRFVCYSFDPGWHTCLHADTQGGHMVMNKFKPERGDPETIEIYVKCHGHEPEQWEE